MGSNASRDKLKECSERRPWKPFRKFSKDPNRLQTFIGNVILIQPDIASGTADTILKLATVIHINLTTI